MLTGFQIALFTLNTILLTAIMCLLMFLAFCVVFYCFMEFITTAPNWLEALLVPASVSILAVTFTYYLLQIPH